MKIKLETPRLLIREIEREDAEDFFEMDSDPEVHRFIDQKSVENKEEIIEIIRQLNNQYQENGIARWAVTDKFTGEMLGWCGLKFFKQPLSLNGFTNIYEHGYRFKQKHWGKGYATESSKAILDWGFKNLKVDAIYAITHPENYNSMHVLEKLGFELKEKFDFNYVHFDIENCNWFKLTKENWNIKVN